MFQRVTDATFLGVFSILYACAVFVLKRRGRAVSAPIYRTRPEPQTQSV